MILTSELHTCAHTDLSIKPDWKPLASFLKRYRRLLGTLTISLAIAGTTLPLSGCGGCEGNNCDSSTSSNNPVIQVTIFAQQESGTELPQPQNQVLSATPTVTTYRENLQHFEQDNGIPKESQDAAGTGCEVKADPGTKKLILDPNCNNFPVLQP